MKIKAQNNLEITVVGFPLALARKFSVIGCDAYLSRISELRAYEDRDTPRVAFI